MAVEIDANDVAHTQNGSSGRPNGYYYESSFLWKIRTTNKVLLFCTTFKLRQSDTKGL